jgi:hypothetical protein
MRSSIVFSCVVPPDNNTGLISAGSYQIQIDDSVTKELADRIINTISSSAFNKDSAPNSINIVGKTLESSIERHIHIPIYTGQYVYVYKWVGGSSGCKVLKYEIVYCNAIDCDWAVLQLRSTTYIAYCPI